MTYLLQKTPRINEGFLWLHGTVGNTNYFIFTISVYYYKGNLLFEEDYFAIIQSNIKPKRETREEKRVRFKHLLNKHNWTRAELARHLGFSGAWVTMVLKN